MLRGKGKENLHYLGLDTPLLVRPSEEVQLRLNRPIPYYKCCSTLFRHQTCSIELNQQTTLNKWLAVTSENPQPNLTSTSGSSFIEDHTFKDALDSSIGGITLSRIHPYCSIYSRSSIGTPSSDGQTCQLVKTKLYLLLATLFLAFGWAPSLLAQVTSGTILGSIQDTTGAVVEGARVTATDRGIGSTRTATSGANGTFSLPNLPVGTYHLTISARGFETVEKNGLVLSSADHLNAGVITLNIGTEATTVTVTADTGQLQLQANSGERSDLITGKQMNDIALNGRNVLDILRVIPGVSGVGQFGASGTGGLDTYSVNGTRTNQHDFVMDGTSNVDSGNNGGTQVTENTDAIAEVKVLTSNFQAEFGKAGGGSIVVTSRGGSNDFHGNLHYFHRNDGMNANDWISNHNGTAKQLFRYNTFGYQIGGPIKKDKLYFFFSNEFYRQLVPGSITQYRTPTALERTGDFSQSVDSSGNPIQIYNPV